MTHERPRAMNYEALAEQIEALAKAATPGEWFDDNLRVDGSNGRNDYYTALYGPSGHIIADTLNSTCVHLEDNGEGRSLDTTGAANAALIVALVNAAPQIVAALREAGRGEKFQQRVQPWMMACFGPEIAADRLERADRFIEEALELCQTAPSFSIERAHALVDYVFNRPQGDINQEVGGVMVTLAAFCLAFNLDMDAAAETELARIWTKVEQIRAKQAAKPKGSALPVAALGDAQ